MTKANASASIFAIWLSISVTWVRLTGQLGGHAVGQVQCGQLRLSSRESSVVL